MVGHDAVWRRDVVASFSEKPTASVPGVLTSTMKLEAAYFLKNLYPLLYLGDKGNEFLRNFRNPNYYNVNPSFRRTA
jgi:hypothetical protein